VISRYSVVVECVVAREVSQAVSLFVPIREVRVPEIRDSAVGAGPHCLRNEGIGRSLVPVLKQRNNMHEPRLAPVFVRYELYEADQVILEECTDEDASIQERRFHFAHGLEILPVMPKAPALPYARFVADVSV